MRISGIAVAAAKVAVTSYVNKLETHESGRGCEVR